jgi:hypothetical protein
MTHSCCWRMSGFLSLVSDPSHWIENPKLHGPLTRGRSGTETYGNKKLSARDLS